MKHYIRISDINEMMSTIANIRKTKFEVNDCITIMLKDIPYEDFSPMHISAMACLTDFLETKGIRCTIQHLPRPTLTLSKGFNLWKLAKSQVETYADNIYSILKKNFYNDTDISAVKGCINEALYNVFDHADAKGVAYICLSLDTVIDKLYVAVCDFGTGIAHKVRKYDPSIKDDLSAIRQAIENQFTTKSKKHNRGYGLDNILSCCNEDDIFKIISNKGTLIAINNKISTFALDYEFPGTLLYFEISINDLPEDEDYYDFI